LDVTVQTARTSADVKEARPRQPFRNPNFCWLYAATFSWNLARWIEMLAVGWVAFELTGSAWDVALTGFFRNVPLLALGLAGGLVADRWDRRTILIVAQVTNLLVTCAIALLLWTHHLAFWHLAVANMLLGVTWVFDWPARRSLLPDLVHKRLVLRAFALDNLNMNMTKVLGPLLGGGLIALVGVFGCYVALGAVYSAALVALFPLVMPPRTSLARGTSVLSNLGAGIRAARASQAVIGVLAITVTMNMLAFPYMQVLPVFAVDVLRVGPTGLGALGAANGLGSFIGAVVMIWYGHQARIQGWLFIIGSGLMCFALALFAMSHWFVPCLLLLMLGGLGQASFGSLQSTIIVNNVDPEVRGRAMGILALAIGSSPIGALLVGALSDARGPAAGIGICAALGLGTVVACAVAIPGLRGVSQARPVLIPAQPPQIRHNELGGRSYVERIRRGR